jgi:hypothetical protein
VAHTEKMLDLYERHMQNHDKYLKWVVSNKLLGQEDSVRNYSSLENQSIRLGSLFYSDESMFNYIRFQKNSFRISMDRIKYVYRLNQPSLIDANLIVRNTFLSL